jgi:alpha-L-fucosidase
MQRRQFVKLAGTATTFSITNLSCLTSRDNVIPSYLKNYEQIYLESPKKAALKWFKNAKFGLFMHFGLYSILERGEWVMLREKIPVAQYEKLKTQFNPKNFNVDFITDLALESGMTYVNITAKHHDSFCLFHTKENDFCSVMSLAKRDLIGELAQACQNKGLGFFCYYSYAADWRHPYFYSREVGWKSARPDYPQPEPQYKWQKDKDFRIYIDFVHNHLRELLTQYGPIAGIWLDPIMGFYSRPDLFPIEETYSLIRSLQPYVLISFKQGANGEEDFAAPERSGHSMADRLENPENKKIAQVAWEKNKNKHNEICDTLQPRIWGYKKDDAGKHRTADEVMNMLENAWESNCNLLLNTGPLPDGSINPTDVKTLKEVGKRLRTR